MCYEMVQGNQVVATGSAHFHTLKPVPSPVKKRPLGPTSMARISCLAKILPLSENLQS